MRVINRGVFVIDDLAKKSLGSLDNNKIKSIIDITLDENTFLRRRPEVEHEREIAIFDLLESNYFELVGGDAVPSPYKINLSLQDNRLIFSLMNGSNELIKNVSISLRAFRPVIKDYFLVCESYFDAIRTMSPSQIEAIDMGRRSLHNEGAKMLEEQLSKNIKLDHLTARCLFTLVCVLHMRG
ncbi:MAG: hypothetical protein CMM25_09595 [Rhodospirillaceae bacterium]|nr:hypothetical protein [Rhodospirillaceae bacterium]